MKNGGDTKARHRRIKQQRWRTSPESDRSKQMEITRRDFFRRLGSRERLATLVGKVSQGWSEVAGSLVGAAAAVSADEAGRSLRRTLRPRQEMTAGPEPSTPLQFGQRETMAPPIPLPGQPAQRPPTSRQSTQIRSILQNSSTQRNPEFQEVPHGTLTT